MRFCRSSHRLLAKHFLKYTKGLRCTHLWTANSIRSSFISYYGEKKHSFIPSSPVIPWNDHSLEFVNAGMNQFKSLLLGTKLSPVKRAVNSQKCIRVGGKHNDLSDVGSDTYHHTFFEMLGSWSFNDYFKEEACKMSWEVLTKVYRIPREHLYVSYFGGDTTLGLEPDIEVKNIWLEIGVPEDRILPFGLEDNFWEMGDVGPCGPSTEIHFERNPSSVGASKVNRGSEDLIEIWNLVFIQYQRMASGALVPLESRFVDTGMGLERLVACLNRKTSNYDTDLFEPLFSAIQKMSGKNPYGGMFSDSRECLDTDYRILADHSRMIAVALSDGLLPHDSYNIRKAIRRSILIGWQKFGLEKESNFLSGLVEEVTRNLGAAYPDLEVNLERSKRLLEYEEEQLKEVQRQISKDWPRLVETHPRLSNLTNVSSKLVEGLKSILPNVPEGAKSFPMDEALRLHETYCIPVEVVEDVVQTLGFTFEKETMKPKRKVEPKKSMSKRASVDLGVNNLVQSISLVETDDSSKYNYTHNPKKGYTYPEHQSTLLKIISDGKIVEKIMKKKSAALILKSTNFYSKSGGQESDFGVIEDGENVFRVFKVEKVGDCVVHFGEMVSGTLSTGSDVCLKVTKGPRLGASKMHTAHHLMRSAIEAVAGMAYQRASQVSEKRLTMDVFVYPELDWRRLEHAESIVQTWIAEKREVTRKSGSLFDVLREPGSNVTLLSGEKYPEDVHVITSTCDLPPDLRVTGCQVNSVTSKELCGGTHILNTGDLENFALTEIKYQGKGVTRVSAACGKEAAKLNANGAALRREFCDWQTRIEEALKNNERLTELSHEFKRWRNGVKKTLVPVTTFCYVEEGSNRLIEQMQEILVQKSNWEELQVEFCDYLSKNPEGSVLYEMKTDYRGPMENLELVIREVSNRPAAFVCKGWGRVRACVYVPKELQRDEAILEHLLRDLKSSFEDGTCKEEGDKEVATFHLNGVKRENLDSTKSQILNTCTKWISGLS